MQKANKIVMTIAGALLIFAGVMKAHQLMTQPILSKGFWESWLFFVIQIPLELGLGIWLLSGLFRKAGWLLASLAYGGFIVVTLIKGITGAASCGCFGTVHVNPWITLFAMDIPVFVLLVIFRPKGCKFFPPPLPSLWHFLGTAVPTALLLPAVVLLLITNKPPQKTEKYEVVNINEWFAPNTPLPNTVNQPDIPEQLPKQTTEPNHPSLAPDAPAPAPQPNNLTRIPEANTPEAPAPEPARNLTEPNQAPAEPDRVQAEPNQPPEETEPPTPSDSERKSTLNPWSMGQYVDIMEKLDSGVSVVYLYHHDCPQCRKLTEDFEQLVRRLGGDEQGIKFAYIIVPPYPKPEQDIVPPGTLALRGKLSEEKEWYFETPVTVLLSDGKVAYAWQTDVPDLEEILNIIHRTY